MAEYCRKAPNDKQSPNALIRSGSTGLGAHTPYLGLRDKRTLERGCWEKALVERRHVAAEFPGPKRMAFQ